MFDPTSRYAALPTALHVGADGVGYVYKQRRFLPQVSSSQPVEDVVVGASDRLDLIAARTLGDPCQFWRIADANGAMDPFELIEPGRVLTIAHGQQAGETP